MSNVVDLKTRKAVETRPRSTTREQRVEEMASAIMRLTRSDGYMYMSRTTLNMLVKRLERNGFVVEE